MPDQEVLADRYTLGDVLGTGGMGTVYAARDQVLGREVAVKVLDFASAPADALDRFRNEGQFLAGLSHPNVVTIFDFGTDSRTAWLVMELLPGPTLEKLLADEGPLPVERVISYGRQCAEGLAAAHAAGITHRDVKPANLMLATDGHCLLVDLGIARLAGASTQPALTGIGTILGTVAYVAPEIITGEIPGPQADQYALGAVLFSLLTGHAPFAGDTSAAIFGQHLHAPPPRPSSARPDTPAALDDLVVSLLAKDPGSRPGAGDVARALAALSGVDSPGEAAVPSTVPLPYPPGAQAAHAATAPDRTQVLSPPAPAAVDVPARRRRRRIAALTGLAVAVATAVAVAALLANTSNEPGPQARPAPGPSSTQPRSPAPSTPAAVPPAITTGPPTSPAGTSSAEAVAALSSAITTVASSGALDASKVQEAQSWVDDFGKELDKSKPKDLRKKIGEFDERLTEYVDKQELDPTGYDLLTARLRDLRSTL